MEITQYIIGILTASLLCAGWIVVQMVARKMKTKNLFDHRPTSCSEFGSSCSCGGDVCEDNKMMRKG
ncbi:hypothetical protein F9K33_11030 [bacterium]|nr:MAG: hypothetical protein F9K33_11030 [bacterium]